MKKIMILEKEEDTDEAAEFDVVLVRHSSGGYQVLKNRDDQDLAGFRVHSLDSLDVKLIEEPPVMDNPLELIE